MPEDRFRKAAKDGRTLLNAWLTLNSPFLIELIGQAGWDCVSIDQQHGIPCIACNRARRSFAPLRVVFLDKVQRHLLDRIGSRQLFVSADRTGHADGVFQRLAADAQEVLVEDARRRIDRALVASLRERNVRQRERIVGNKRPGR